MLGEMTIESAAAETAGNWRNFESFVWYGRPDSARENPAEWALVYTHNRDSGALDKSNAHQIAAALAPFETGDDGDCIAQNHNHCLCGWVEGFAIRVYRNGEITEAFRVYHGLCERLASYSILDEAHHSELQNEEIESGWENWARHDFETALEKRFCVDVRDGAKLREVWNKALDSGAAHWHEESSGMFIDVSRVVKSIAADDALPLLDTTVSEATETIATLLIDAIEAQSIAGLIYSGAGSNPTTGGLPEMQNLEPYYADELFRILYYFKTQYPALVESCGVREPALSKALCELDHIASVANR